MKAIVTGGAGFIGQHLVRNLLSHGDEVLTIDALTYAAGPIPEFLADHPSHSFVQADICDFESVRDAFCHFRPTNVFHLAAETHVDRSIGDPGPFVRSNIIGTYNLLEAARSHIAENSRHREGFRFIHVSTDEVFGQLGERGSFTESSPYQPRSPYSASKASSDHLVQAWQATYGLPTIITRASNNYGPGQHAEKLIPSILRNAIQGTPIPIYGQGAQIRDWLHVDDHVRALRIVAENGTTGRSYNISGNEEHTNLDIARRICSLLDQLRPLRDGQSHAALITLVKDRPGHDFRYSMDHSLIRSELGWEPRVDLQSGLETTVRAFIGASAH